MLLSIPSGFVLKTNSLLGTNSPWISSVFRYGKDYTGTHFRQHRGHAEEKCIVESKLRKQVNCLHVTFFSFLKVSENLVNQKNATFQNYIFRFHVNKAL